MVGVGKGRSLAWLGRPRAILRCKVMLLVMRLSPIACVRTDPLLLVKQTISTCHRQFIYTTYHCQSSLEHILPVTAGKSYSRPQCAIFRIVATVIDYFSLLVTACHRLFTYHCLAPVLAGKNEHRLVLFAGKSEHHLDLINTCFTPTNFYVHGSQVKVHPGARACSFRFHHVRTHTNTDTTNCKYRCHVESKRHHAASTA